MGKNELLPLLAMAIVQVGYSGMNLISKVAMQSGLPPLVLVSYRLLFATIAISPFAYFFEREKWPKMTKSVLYQIFLCSLFGATFNQIGYFVGLEKTTATLACAMNNTIPAMTFLLAVPLGLEEVGIRKRAGQAKILGTILCISGAMVLSFYHGHLINIHQPNINWPYSIEHRNKNKNGSNRFDFLVGPLFLLGSALAMAIWFVLQAKVSKTFQAPYTISALMGFMGAIQSVFIAVCMNHKISDWSLTSHIRLFASLYVGIVGSGIGVCLISWVIQRKGPLYVSVFNPLLLIIVALVSWALRMEKLYIGTPIGSVLIVSGLYTVLWGKNKEIKKGDNETNKIGIQSEVNKINEAAEKKEDMEKQQQSVELKAGDDDDGHHHDESSLS